MKIVPFQSARSPRRLCQRPLVLLMGVILSASCVSAAAEVASAGGGPPQVEFDSAFLIGSAGSNADISRFERGDSAPPGDYRVDLYVNDQRIGRTDVSFRSAGAAGRVQACITSDLLRRTGADLSQVSAEVPETMAADSDCVGIDAVVDGALDVFDFAAQRLDLSIPQVALLRTPRGYVNPDSWNAGVSATTVPGVARRRILAWTWASTWAAGACAMTRAQESAIPASGSIRQLPPMQSVMSPRWARS